MKRKLFKIFLIIVLLITNYAFIVEAASLTYTREGGTSLNNIAKIIDDDIYLDGEYTMYSVGVLASDIEIYDYNSTQKKNIYANEGEIPESDDDAMFYNFSLEGTQQNLDMLRVAVKLGSGEQKCENVATIVYKNGIRKNGLYYDVKLNINEINKTGDSEIKVMYALGSRTHNEELNKYDFSTYINRALPNVSAGYDNSTDFKAEVKVEYSIIDSNGNELPISGILGVIDLDLYQGVAIEDFKATRENTFMYDVIDSIKYKINNDNTYIYSTIDSNTDNDNAYILLTNRNSLNMVFSWDNNTGTSNIEILKDVIKRYYNIDTEVVGGTITSPIKNIKNGENRTITYAPNNSATQYLKSVRVDGVEQPVELYKDSYTFSNISDGHTIRVEYDNLYKVVFDAKGGSPTPDNQYVKAGAVATEPSTDPTKKGYVFGGWQQNGKTGTYDFGTAVNSNITLNALWNPASYKINYELDGGTNDSRNLSTYTIEDTINFQSPTRAGYTFKGWYEDSGLKTPIAGISYRTGDVTVYAKWEAKKDIGYKVQHYKKNTSGSYVLATTDTLTGTADEAVTATPKNYTGYKENTSYSARVPSGTIKADGSLVLKLYYEPISYEINYVLNGGINDSKNPSTYTVNDTVNFQPATREGYDFIGWYEDATFTKPIASIANKTGNITVYAKYEAKKDIAYTVEHYKKNAGGKYILTTTDILTGTTNEAVTATAKVYGGYQENTTHPSRVASGTVKADGSLELRLYYDPITYKIDYELNGGTNSKKNPTTYTVEDEINFEPATKPGYDFVGWFEDAGFTTPIAGIENRTGNVKVYSKWEARKDIEYKVEHYKEGKDGKYELAVTDTLVGRMDEEVTAEAKEFTGYVENTKLEDRVATGTVKADGSLVLKLYYDKVQYTVTFVPDNGTEIPNQTVLYQDKATEPTAPTKEDYEFKGWYYTNENGQEVTYNFDDPVTSNLKLTAKWAKIEIPVPEKDNTTAPTKIPQTGDFNAPMVFTIIAITTLAGVFGIKYFKLKIK